MSECCKSGTNKVLFEFKEERFFNCIVPGGFCASIIFFPTNITSVTAQGGMATGMLLPQQPQASKSNDWYPKWSWMLEVRWVRREG